MSNFLKISTGVPRSAQVQGTDIGSGAATSAQVLAANGSSGSAFRSLLASDLPTITLTGNVTGSASGGSISTVIAANVVANSMLSQMAAHTYKGNNTGSTANAADITSTQLTADLNLFTSSLQGLTPASGGGTSNFLRADGTWALPSTTSGTVTSVSVVTANGFAGTVATATATPAITISTTITGLLKGNGTAISAAGSADLPTITLTGDVTGAASGGSISTTIASGVVTATKLGTITDGSTLDQAGAGSTLEIKTGGILNIHVNGSAAIAYSKLANIGGSTNAVLIQSGTNKVSASSILSTNLFLADGSVVATGNYNMNSNKIVSLANGTASGDAVNFSQLTSLATGLIWQNSILDPDLVNDSLSTPPGSPLYSATYIIAASPTGVWTGLAGHAVWWNGSSWTDISTNATAASGFGTAVQVGDRFLVAAATTGAPALIGGGLTGKPNNIAQITTNTPGSIAYTFTVPLNNYAVNTSSTGSQHYGSSFTYSTTTTSWIDFSGPAKISAGSALAYNGNTLNVQYDNVTIDLTGNNLEVKSGGISNTQINASAAIAYSKLASMSTGQILLGNGGVATATTVSGDMAISSSGVATVQNSAITNVKLASMPANTVKANITGVTGTATDVSLGTVTESTSSVLTLTGWANATIGSPTIQVKQATTSVSGYLSSTDFTTFNNKQPAGNYVTALTGDVAASGPGSAAATIQANVVSNAKLAQMAANTVKANATGSTANATDVTLASAATASSVMFRDSSSNTKVNNLIENMSTTATAAATTTLTVASSYMQQFTGITTQTVVLPDATTLTLGHSFLIANRSTGTVTLNANGGGLIQSLAAGSQTVVTLITNSVAAGTWDSAYSTTSSSALPSVYDQIITVVTSGGNGSTTLNGPITSGTSITLPSSGSYLAAELQIYLNGLMMYLTGDWNTVSTTAFSFTYNLVVGDVLHIVKLRNN